jgi:hypothetical protein
MAPRKALGMSKKLEKQATRLERKAQNRALTIKRVVREYRNARQASEAEDIARQTQKHREIERAARRYNEVHKALRRISKKIELKTKETRRPTARSFGGR